MAGNMDEVVNFAKKHNLKIVEDRYRQLVLVGMVNMRVRLVKLVVFRFLQDKTITTGEGGLVVTNDDGIYEKLLFIRNQGRIDRGSFIHPEIGYNFRMTDIQSADRTCHWRSWTR
jgi:perosamine synthetase